MRIYGNWHQSGKVLIENLVRTVANRDLAMIQQTIARPSAPLTRRSPTESIEPRMTGEEICVDLIQCVSERSEGMEQFDDITILVITAN
jgi:hypothetical protein